MIEEKELVERLDFEDFREKLGLWADKLKPFIESKEMYDIFQTIKEDAAKETILPTSDKTFRSFETTNPDDLKVIFLLQDPYAKFYYHKGKKIPQATGIAMDCSNAPDGKLQPSLENFYAAMEEELGRKVLRSPDLTYLHQQGVMLLNTDLTCKAFKSASHSGLWEPFQKYVLEEVLGSDTHIIYVICGKPSLRLEKYINPFCKIFKIEHPAAGSYNSRAWDSQGIFKKINNVLKDNNLDQIFWNKEEWDEYSEPPF